MWLVRLTDHAQNDLKMLKGHKIPIQKNKTKTKKKNIYFTATSFYDITVFLHLHLSRKLNKDMFMSLFVHGQSIMAQLKHKFSLWENGLQIKSSLKHFDVDNQFCFIFFLQKNYHHIRIKLEFVFLQNIDVSPLFGVIFFCTFSEHLY